MGMGTVWQVRAELATEEEGEQGVAVEEKGGEARDRKRRSMEVRRHGTPSTSPCLQV
jgi:hypothetical protein